MKPYHAGLAQAFGLSLYISLFVLFVHTAAPAVLPHTADVVRMMLFLLAFSGSALVCGTTTLAYPTLLVLQRKWREAVMVIVWTVLGILLFAGMAYTTASIVL